MLWACSRRMLVDLQHNRRKVDGQGGASEQTEGCRRHPMKYAQLSHPGERFTQQPCYFFRPKVVVLPQVPPTRRPFPDDQPPKSVWPANLTRHRRLAVFWKREVNEFPARTEPNRTGYLLTLTEIVFWRPRPSCQHVSICVWPRMAAKTSHLSRTAGARVTRGTPGEGFAWERS